MRQIFAIFIKDARRFWPEILVTLAVLVALVVVYPHTWGARHEAVSFMLNRLFSSGSILGFLAGCLAGLVPVAWWILIARMVHGERLVGHTQFWLTRPYEWPKFLAAKLLFLAVFLYLPFFMAQCVLLAEGGFQPFAYLPGLFSNLVLVTGILVLPLTALSVVTTGFGRMTLVLLGTIVFIAGMALLYSLLPSGTGGGETGPLGDYLSFWIAVGGCSVAILVQYARRRTRVAWVLIAAVAVSLSALAFFDPDPALMNRRYPAPGANETRPVEITYAAFGLHQPMTTGTRDKSELEIDLPMRTTGVADGFAIFLGSLKATIEGPGGARWESPWQPVFNERYLPGTWDSSIRFRIRRSVYDQFKAGPVNLHLTLAIEKVRATGVSRIPLSSSEFTVPGVGICTPQSSWFGIPPEITGISCRSAMRGPRLNYVTAQWTDTSDKGACSTVPEEPDTVLGTTWIGSFQTDSAEFGITSVWEAPLYFSNNGPVMREGKQVWARELCPGTPITFTSYELAGRSRLEVSIPNFRLPELALGDQYQLRLR